MATELPLGRPTTYPRDYDPSLLVGIPREQGRRALGISGEVPFSGVDVWHAHELSWLDEQGKPVVATAELWVPATTPCLVESKSLKLYLHSFNATRRSTPEAVRETIGADLRRVLGGELQVKLTPAAEAGLLVIERPPGTCIDAADVRIDSYQVRPELLAGSVSAAAAGDDAPADVEETLYTHLLKTNCPVTAQPDWATLIVRYAGPRIDRAALLAYIVSYRDHDDFHEQCVERIFLDLKRHCRPRALTVHALYTRRGGIDINPFRSDCETLTEDLRVWRQ